MSSQAEIVAAARKEIERPALAVTAQILAVHQLKLRDGEPELVWMSTPRRPGELVQVHFAIAGEPYLLGVAINDADPRRAVAAYLEAAVVVSLIIKSDSVDPEEIALRLGLSPSSSQKKGVPRRPGASAPTNFWKLKATNQSGTPDLVIADFIAQLEPAADRISAIASLPDTEACVEVVYHGNADWMSGLHLDAATAKKLAAMGAGFDVALYATGPSLPE